MVAERSVQVRSLTGRDVRSAGEILYRAFTRAYERRGFRPPFPSPETGAWLAQTYLDLDPGGAIAAVRSGEVVGVGFLHVRGPAATIGPVAARPETPGGVGRALMEELILRCERAGVRSLRLFQDAFNPRSFALYTKLGFVVRDVVGYAIADRPTVMAAPPQGQIRPIEPHAIEPIVTLDATLGASDRRIDFELLLPGGAGYALWRDNRPEAFLFVRPGSSRIALAPGAARSTADLLALVAHAISLYPQRGLAIRVPQQPPELMATLLSWGFEIEHLGNLMVRGENKRAPAVLYALFPESL